MEFLKPVLGDELYVQLETALKGNDKIKLANLADGGYVAKDKFDKADADRKTAEEKVAALEKVDAAALQADNEKLKGENATLQRDRKLDAKLYAEQAKDVIAVGALLDKSKISLDEAGNLVGADDQIAALKQSKGWAFGEVSVPGAGGNPPPAGGGGDAQKTTWGAAIEERIAQQ